MKDILNNEQGYIVFTIIYYACTLMRRRCADWLFAKNTVTPPPPTPKKYKQTIVRGKIKGFQNIANHF